jgi:membrane protease YdiL (CAAX protease family)
VSGAEPPPPRPDVEDRLVGPDPIEADDEVTWSWWEAPVVYLVAMVIAAVPILIAAVASGSDASAVDTGPTYILALVVTELAFFGVVLFWVAVVHSTRLSILWPPKKPLRDLAVGIPAGLGLYIVGIAVSLVTDQVYEWIAGHGPPSPDQVPKAVTGAWLILTGIGVVFLAPLGEETLFRGFLYRGLRRSFTYNAERRRLPVWAAAVISGGLFGLGHLQGLSFFVLVPPLWAVGIGLAFVYQKRRSLLASMAAHGTFNVIGFLFLFASRR